ncbi:MAG: peptidyl-prolyl cis-trans isomerase [Deltaproteobacteria bacterium]|nr:peptidyl-prolyl cis-trans isomerase [Deltaproteobacteria bacterium]
MKTLLLVLFILFAFCASAETVDRIIAKVGSEVITQSDVAQDTAQRKAFYTQKYGKQRGLEEFNKFQKDALNEMILMRVLNEQIIKEGLELTEREITEEYQQRLRQSGINEKQLIEKLGDNGVTLRDFKESIKKEIERTRFIQKKISPLIAISDFDLQKEYEKNIKSYEVYTKLRFIEVFLTIDKFENADQMNSKAQQMQQKLKAGQNISALVKEYSSGAFAAQGGDSGLVDADQLRPEIQSVLSSLSPGQISQILPIQNGLFIFKLIAKSDPRPLPFNEVANQIRSQFSEKMIEDELKKYLTVIKDQTYVEIMQ